ncbi:MAG: hypothetical protein AAB305_07580 [Candidatus Zixiibacteriota bacterium]
MSIGKLRSATSLILATILVSCTTPSFVNADVSVNPFNFLLESNSPRAIAMGGCAINSVTPESPLSNPAALRLFHLDHLASVNFPNSSKLLSGLGVNDLRFRTWGVSGGSSLKSLKNADSLPINFSVGLSYAYRKTDYGTIYLTKEYAGAIDSFEAYDEMNYLSAGIGVEIHRFLRIGVGYSYRILEFLSMPASSFGWGKLKGNTHDYGFIAQVRVHELARRKSALSQPNSHRLQLELIPSYAMVKINDGGSMSYENGPGPFPFGMEATNSGASIFASLDLNAARLVSVYWTQKANSRTSIQSHGMEFGLADMLFYRFGRSGSSGHSETKGAGISLGGLMAWLEEWGKLDTEHSSVHRFMRKLDIRYDYAEREGLDKFHKLTLSLLQ